MVHQNAKCLILAFLISASTTLIHADTGRAEFEFSQELTSSLEAHAAKVEALTSEIRAALDGLPSEAVDDVMTEYSEDISALRKERMMLRDKGVTEMAEADFYFDARLHHHSRFDRSIRSDLH